MAARLLPLELIDKCIGSRLWIIMKGDKVRRPARPDSIVHRQGSAHQEIIKWRQGESRKPYPGHAEAAPVRRPSQRT